MPRANVSSEVPPSPRLLTIQAAAVYLSATVWAVRQLIWSKELRAIRMGRRIVIDRSDLDALVNERLSAA